MKFFYTPILKWKQGEYMGLSRLKNEIKDHVVPLIEIPKIGYDFENGQDAKTIDEHVQSFPKRFLKHWGNRRAFIDTALVDGNILEDGRQPIQYIFDALKEENHNLVPVIGLDRPPEYQAAVYNIFKASRQKGICIRLTIEDFQDDGLDELLNQLSAEYNDCDLILDLGAPNFSDIENFSSMMVNVLASFKDNNWKSITICGTAFPENVSAIKIPGGPIDRNEWKLYQEILNKISNDMMRPNFGDYAISHPNTPEGDMRLFSPAASIRYTTDNAWYVARGKRVRPNSSDKKKEKLGEKFEGFSQFSDLCEKLSVKDIYSGAEFSEGDKYILGCASKTEKTGNLSTWRWVGNNHHITKVVSDLRAKKLFS